MMDHTLDAKRDESCRINGPLSEGIVDGFPVSEELLGMDDGRACLK